MFLGIGICLFVGIGICLFVGKRIELLVLSNPPNFLFIKSKPTSTSIGCILSQRQMRIETFDRDVVSNV